MGELLNVVVAFAVIAFAVRWATKRNDTAQNGPPSGASVLGFRPKTINEEMVNTVQTMFPDIPRDNIRYDLLKSGSTEVTSNKILEKGFLDAPPEGYHQLYPRAADAPTNDTINPPTTSRTQKPATPVKPPSLISKFGLQERVEDSIIEEDPQTATGSTKGVWEATAEKREQSLRERKAQMVLAARKRLQDEEKRRAKGKGKEVSSSFDS